MTPCVIIPTFWTRRKGRFTDRLINVYDHPTPIDEEGTLGACLTSLEPVTGLGRVIVLVAATDASVEHEAEDRVRQIVDKFPRMDILIFGPAELGSLQRRLEQIEFPDMVPGVSLTGYGAVRNVGLIVAATLGCEAVVFLDDDAVVTDRDFLAKAMQGLGMKTPDGKVVFAKSGIPVDEAGSPLLADDGHWADAFWRTTEKYNNAMSDAMNPPRVRPSNVACGSCLALHRDMFANVSFDPWVLRGEDIDYLINARMHGADVFIDNEWRVVHKPPAGPSEALALRQDVYRYIYEHRKLEFARSQIDLRKLSAASLKPFPGDMVGSAVTWRAFVTAVLHALTGKEFGAFIDVAKAAMGGASRYARQNCDNYFAFQRRWPLMLEALWEDVALGSLFSGERRVDRTAITGRFPVLRDE